jgi:phosphohistidine phosphatase
MKSLHLLRHAKSRRDNPKLADHDRPLSSRGMQDAMAIAEHCANTGIHPDLVLCSSSLRTRATLALLIPYLPPVLRILIERGLYLASVADLFARLRDVGDDSASVLLVGHNDDLHELAKALAGAGEPALRERLQGKFPTGALASFNLASPSWRSLGVGSGALVGLVTPKELHC